jgi:phosphate/sulfate permease
MRLINIARRSLALSIALLILIFSCCYVSFHSSATEVSGKITITAKVYKVGLSKSSKKNPIPFSEKLPSHPKLALNKRIVTATVALFILSFLCFLFLKLGNHLVYTYLKRSYPANLLLFLCSWRI